MRDKASATTKKVAPAMAWAREKSARLYARAIAAGSGTKKRVPAMSAWMRNKGSRVLAWSGKHKQYAVPALLAGALVGMIMFLPTKSLPSFGGTGAIVSFLIWTGCIIAGLGMITLVVVLQIKKKFRVGTFLALIAFSGSVAMIVWLICRGPATATANRNLVEIAYDKEIVGTLHKGEWTPVFVTPTNSGKTVADVGMESESPEMVIRYTARTKQWGSVQKELPPFRCERGRGVSWQEFSSYYRNHFGLDVIEVCALRIGCTTDEPLTYVVKAHR